VKKLARNIVAAILGYQVRKLTKKNNLKVIGVVGSIGKTSTKLAIARVLETGFKTRYQDGNYNDLVTVPLIFFDETLPGLFNPLAWLALFWRNQKKLKQNYPYEVIVVELGSDGPGQIGQFKRYLDLEIAVVTSITPEHMQFFSSLDEVAKEELSVSKFSSLILANKDLCDDEYLAGVDNLLTYGVDAKADFGPTLDLQASAKTRPQQYSALAAIAVAQKLGLDDGKIKTALKNIKPVAGRMQELAGINGSLIIDDSYNASPEAVKLALDALYETKSPQKIAVLGNMNELGDYAKAAHEEIGRYCDPKQLELVVTLGPDANQYLAPAAEAKGCKVESFDSPYDAGDFLKPLIKPGAAILVKGSQNKVFAEETVKLLLANPQDSVKLVRQSDNWMAIKNKAFNK
jgi:UDP-N-acetylmuramoyl-tripeptide--D-alanyl-D-alanine ligase